MNTNFSDNSPRFARNIGKLKKQMGEAEADGQGLGRRGLGGCGLVGQGLVGRGLGW